MKTNESKKGISLIVLIITILVMIIIAAAIILNIDDTKIINNAEKATSNNNLAAAKEIRVVARTEWRINEAKLRDEGYKSFKDYLESKIDEAGITNVYVSEKGTILEVYEDEYGDKAIIPEGFVVSRATGEDTISGGLVIYEGKEAVTDSNVVKAQETRNQFVWIPVDDYSRFERTSTYKPKEDITSPSASYKEPYTTSTYTEEEKEYLAMRASVKEYNGFYIARYEAGLPEGKTPTTVTQADIPVSKKVASVWNKIPWGTSMTEIGTEGAVYRARQMYKDTISVVSTLCYGVQWDAALQFIATKDENYAIDSTGKGYYTVDSNGNFIEGVAARVQPTGIYVVNNIYDMAGNVAELTMEYYYIQNRVIRGGYLGFSGSSRPASNRSLYYFDDAASSANGFRVALYIK